MRTVALILLALAVAAPRASAQFLCSSEACPPPRQAGYLIVPTEQERGSARDLSELLAGRAAGLYVRRTGARWAPRRASTCAGRRT